MLIPQEVEELFGLLKRLKAEGKSIVIITHHLNEAIEISDRITVMRKGEVVETLDEQQVEWLKQDVDKGIKKLARLMVGREILYELDKEKVQPGGLVLKLEDLKVKNDMGAVVVKGVNLELKNNQILGLAGIAGNGQKELIEGILHLREVESGVVYIHNENMTGKPIKAIRENNVSYIPEDRRKAIILDLSIRENLLLNDYDQYPGFFLRQDEIVEKTNRLIEQFDIRAPSPLTPMRNLSGGNKQKVIVAREMSRDLIDKELILLAENPTVGLDVATTQFVREQLLQVKKNGSVLLVSSDLTELLSLCDEVAVIYEGEIMGVAKANETTREEMGLMMGGIKKHKVKALRSEA